MFCLRLQSGWSYKGCRCAVIVIVVPVCSEVLFRELSLLRSRQLLASKHDVIVTFMQPGMECRDELYFHRSGMIKQLSADRVDSRGVEDCRDP